MWFNDQGMLKYRESGRGEVYVARWIGYISPMFETSADTEIHERIVKVLNRELPNGKPRRRRKLDRSGL